MKKKWYDYLWILSVAYLILGFFNILFGWLGLLCFFIPLIISIRYGTKGYCNRYCGRGQFANYAQTECQFRYCGTAIPFLTVRSTAR